MQRSLCSFADLAAELSMVPGSVRLVGVDGCGGAGKTTFSARLSHALDGAPVVHTDDFASYDEPLNWWPRLLSEVIEPLLRKEPATFRPYDWVARRPAAELITVTAAPVVVIEGVGATRNAWRDRLALRVWVDCPRDIRLARGLARDGADMVDFWTWWMAEEHAYVTAERPWAHADLVIDGAPELGPETEYDADLEFVEISVSAPR